MSAAPKLSSESIAEERKASTAPILESNTADVEISRQNDMAQLAYALWQQRGCPIGSSETDWLEAEQQLSSQNSLTKNKSLGQTSVSTL